jgi:hypothetical protein
MALLLITGLCAGGAWWFFRQIKRPTPEETRRRARLPWNQKMTGDLERARKKALRGQRLNSAEKCALLRELVARGRDDVDL